MREFIYGEPEQFRALCDSLPEEGGQRFRNRVLPRSCSKNSADLWFGKRDGGYVVYIDGGISTTADHPAFRHFLERGEAVFFHVEEMISFFHSLRPLMKEEPRRAVVDKGRLREIKEEQSKEQGQEVWPEQLSQPLKQKVYGQDQAIDALCDKVVMNRMRKTERLLSVVLLGPTATGKSETAKSLAQVMGEAYKTPYGYIEIAGSEFIGEHTVHRFFGSPPGYVGHGQPTLLEPVRKNPYHVIVINEIEKADEKILVGLMETIDTGVVHMADNSKPIDLSRCVLLLTSNIPIDMEKYNSASEFQRSEMCRDAFTKHCGRPEISGKIGNFIAFQPLSMDATTDIVVKFVREELDSYDLRLARIDEYLMADFLEHQSKYGARAIRGLVADTVGRRLLRERKREGLRDREVVLKGSVDHIDFELV